MCGIFLYLTDKDDYYNSDKYYVNITNNFEIGKNRGPEFSTLNKYDNILLGFHRLAINGLNNNSNQPFEIDNLKLICNGEIYNYKNIAKDLNITLNTDSDCEIILHLYKLFGIEYTLNILDGVFSFILYDNKINKIYIARDPYGVRPLYYFFDKNIENENHICFASELKVLYNLSFNKKHIQHFTPGSYMLLDITNYKMEKYIKYTNFPCFNKNYILNDSIDKNLFNEIYKYISNAVYKRVIGTTERPIACLLSGGLDSSLVACLVNKFLKTKNENNVLNTFSIGLQGSEDLKYAKIVANHLNSNHHEIIVSEDDFFDAIPEVIKNIESYDTTTIRASVGNYLIGKYIKENSDCKVIFNGDGADELMGGYLYFKQSPNEYEFDKETRRLLNDIHTFDVLRSDRCISVHGLEPRTPFLDRKWVEFYLSIDRKIRYNTTKENCEKYLIRKSFELMEPELLPKEVLWRTKEAFSDGVSSLNKSWFEIIKEKIKNKMSTKYYNQQHNLDYQLISLINNYKLSETAINKPDTYEKAYYRMIYNRYYNNTDHLIPYFWMPKYVKANDASARTLDVYKNNNNNININNNNDNNNDNDNDNDNEICMI